jgi:two-component system, OmpR family, sensor histidine kinase TctE
VTARCGTDSEGRVFLEVEDNGQGIPKEAREHIFERFYRAAGTAGQGTGLGLAIVKEVADRHSATIHLDNATPGAGTRCRIIFPTIDKAQ